ncbi:MAG: hypothetical protein K1X57_16915 [Gemmataceae bacterium]|nr:hypothetical protein [Gemmataceae bacterium]
MRQPNGDEQCDPLQLQAIQLYEDGHLAAVIQILHPIASGGNVVAQYLVGSIMLYGQHLFATANDYANWRRTTAPAEQALLLASIQSDRQAAIRFLEFASIGGEWRATNNLLVAYCEFPKCMFSEPESVVANRLAIQIEKQRKGETGSG